MPLEVCRHKHKELRRSSWINDSEVQWHGTEPAKPDWTEASRFLAYTLGKPGGGGLYIAFNSSHLPQARRGERERSGALCITQGEHAVQACFALLASPPHASPHVTPPHLDLPSKCTSHAQVVQLPRWPGRVWQLVADTSKVAPFDVLVADDQLPEEEVAAQRASMDMWKLEHCYPMLPWSSVVLESVPEAAKSAMPQHRKQGSGTGF
jgi:isoamylase